MSSSGRANNSAQPEQILATPSTHALSIVRNSIDRAVHRARSTIDGVPGADPTDVLQDLRNLKLLAGVLTAEPPDPERMSALQVAIEQLSRSDEAPR